MNSRESLQEKSKDELIDHILDLNDKIGSLMNAVTELKQEVERLKQPKIVETVHYHRHGTCFSSGIKASGKRVTKKQEASQGIKARP
jgi:hypothetical protein